MKTVLKTILLAACAVSCVLLLKCAADSNPNCKYCGSSAVVDCDRFFKCRDCGAVFH